MKAVEAASRKPVINPAHCRLRIAYRVQHGQRWITQEEADKARQIIKETSEAKAANLPQQMIENITKGRLNKFFKESCLMEQEYVKDASMTIGQFLEQSQKGLVAVSFKRVNLNED
mgnify:CR=1 FL=1